MNQMDMPRYFFMFCFMVLASLSVYGQQTKAEYINAEFQILQQRLANCPENCALTNEQRNELTPILAEKADRVIAARTRLTSKDDLSTELLKIEKDFAPRINKILTLLQRKFAESLHQTAF